jgi:hypothetical protein
MKYDKTHRYDEPITIDLTPIVNGIRTALVTGKPSLGVFVAGFLFGRRSKSRRISRR